MTSPLPPEATIRRRSQRARRRQFRLRRAALVAGLLLVLVSLVVLLGWAFGVEAMKSFGPHLVSMKIHTALGLGEAGALIAFASVGERGRSWAALACLTGVVPALTLVEYLTGHSLGIDNVFGADHTDLADFPGRMAPPTAVALTALALALAATFLDRVVLAQVAAAVDVLVALTAVTGYLFGVEAFYRVQQYISIAPSTTVCLGVAGVAVLAMNTTAGILSVLVGTTAGGVIARALLPPIVVFQMLVAGAVLVGVATNAYDYRFGFALVAVVNVVGGVTLVLGLAYVLRTQDLRRAGAEAALLQANEQSAELVAENQVLADFAAMAAHDLRGPLASVRGYAELLAEDFGDDVAVGSEARRDLVLRIERAARRGDEMISDMLAFARLGAQPLELETVDLGAEIREISDEVSQTHERPLLVRVGDLPRVHGDRSLLRLLITNVLGNAAKYVPDTRPARIDVDGAREDGEVVIGFTDNGEGIAQADRGRLMRIFERGPASQRVAGTGIGLAICVRVAEVHGGRFWIEDGRGGGACFRLALPDRG